MAGRRVESPWLLLCCLCAGCASVAPTGSPDGKQLDASSGRDLVSSIDFAAPPDLNVPMDLALAAPLDLGPFPANAIYQISNKQTGGLLSVHGSSVANGSITEQQPAHSTPDQRWSVVTLTAGVYQLVNANSQTCLDVNGASTADGATTWIWTCSSSVGQEWLMQNAGSGYYNIINVNSQSCLDLDNGGTAPGTVIFQYHCKGGDNQKWLFTRVN
jgi:hypothetical protein